MIIIFIKRLIKSVMLLLLLCAVLFPNLPSVHGTPYETSYPSYYAHTYETQPEITYHTYQTSEPGQISQIFQQYPWLTQWQQKLGLTNVGTFGFSQSSQDFGGGHNGNVKENTNQENANENPFTQASNQSEDIDNDDNSQAAETISTPAPDETDESDDNSEPPPFPNATSDDDDSEPLPYPYDTSNVDESYPGESSGDEPPKYFDEPPIDETRDRNASTQQNNDTKSIITPKQIYSEARKNTTKPKPYPTTSKPPSGPQPGTMSRPVPKLGLLFAPSLQWHVGIYSKTFTPYKQVCGGSLVMANVVLSAAHCFWNDDVGALRPGLFAVAAGKLLRPWEIEGEIYTQHSDIKDIKIPPRFRGSKTSFQDDIAIVLLTRSLEYAPGVRPVCISFDLKLDGRHLTSGNLGKIAGWGLTEPNGPPSQRLNYLELPYVDIEECLRTADDSFLKYITSDKICAGDQKTGRALCRGDSGGGLIYYSSSIPYLHGIASTAPRDKNICNAYAVASFTHVQAHRRFLIGHVPHIGEGCEELYVNKTGIERNETEIKREDAGLTPSGPQAQEEDRISTNFALESGMSNVSGQQISLTAPTQNYKNEDANIGEPISLTVLSQNNINGVSNTGETISNPTLSSQDENNEQTNTEELIFLTVPYENDKNGVSNIGEAISNPTVSSQDKNNEDSNTEEPIFLTVPSQNDINGVSNIGETISNPTLSSQDENNEQTNTEEPIFFTEPYENYKNGVSNIGKAISYPTVSSQDKNNEDSNTEEPIFLTVPSENDKNRMSNTGEAISNTTVSIQNDKNGMSNTGEQISLTVPDQKDNNRESNTEIQSNLTNKAGSRPIWETNEKEEVVINVGSGKRGVATVARISVDNSTRTFVCNCYCNSENNQ